MAVPTSGTLSMLKLAREAKHGDYNGTQTMGMISLYDMINGGNERGSTVSYPTVNDDCLPNPIDRTYTSFQFTNSGTPLTVYVTTTLALLAIGDIIYSNTNGNIYTGGGTFIQTPKSSFTTLFTGTCECPGIFVNTTTGAITGISCGCP